MSFNPLFESVQILMNPHDSDNSQDYKSILAIMEDVNSPITQNYQEKLYRDVIDKGHIDFGSIAKSEGIIKNYIGYENMIETLQTIKKLGVEQRNVEAVKYSDIVLNAIMNLNVLSDTYNKGFISKTEYVMLEYNTYAYTCVEATSTLLYEFVDYIKRPDKISYDIVLKNTKFRANLFYFDQLLKFNNVMKTMSIKYRNFLNSVIMKGKSNFVGVETIVGAAAISMVALSIIPITRKLIWYFWKLRGDLSNSLEYQANFLEMNRACIESNQQFTEQEKQRILKKQDQLRSKLMTMSDKLKIRNIKAVKEAERDIMQADKELSISNIKKDISNAPFDLI